MGCCDLCPAAFVCHIFRCMSIGARGPLSRLLSGFHGVMARAELAAQDRYHDLRTSVDLCRLVGSIVL